jgi:glycosyltransferase involved in cell wall biosynthesis
MASKIRILHFSTHNEDCGIGKYQEMFLEAMQQHTEVENNFFDISPNQTKVMPPAELEKALQRLSAELVDYDILHVQHEFSFFSETELARVCEIAKERGKKLVVTIHTAPAVAYQRPGRPSPTPRSVLHYIRARRHAAKLFTRYIEPLKLADLVLVHNEVTKQGLIGEGIPAERIGKIVIPVPKFDFRNTSDIIKRNLKVVNGDVVYCTAGFLHRYKGVKEAVKALSFLPANYKLAIIGGMHPFSNEEQFYDEITDLVRDLGLIDRVYIAGYIADDEKMNAAIRECDLCVYPYDKIYYSNVSSAALNNAFANHMPVIGYPTASFKELNTIMPAISITQSCSYYEMAKVIKDIDLTAARQASTKFAEEMSYPRIMNDLVGFYKGLIS